MSDVSETSESDAPVRPLPIPDATRLAGEVLDQVERGRATVADVAAIAGWLDRVTDGSRCFLATEERRVVASVLRSFPDELAQHLDDGRCPLPGERPMPKLVDLAGGRATYDTSYWRKQPDWTYKPDEG